MDIDVALTGHDWLNALIADEAHSDGLRLRINREAGLGWVTTSAEIVAGEGSLSAHIQRISAGDRSFAAIPLFAARGFVHRKYLVRADSIYRELSDLGGRRVGIGKWGATGNTWARAVLREVGVAPESIEWVTDVDAGVSSVPSPRLAERPLIQMLLEGGLDAVVSTEPLEDLATYHPAVRRLAQDYRTMELAYWRRTGIVPLHHVVLVRQEFALANPSALGMLFQRLSDARTLWVRRCIEMEDGSPWSVRDLYDSGELSGDNWYRDGLDSEANRTAIAAVAGQLSAERVIGPVPPVDEIFGEFLTATR